MINDWILQSKSDLIQGPLAASADHMDVVFYRKMRFVSRSPSCGAQQQNMLLVPPGPGKGTGLQAVLNNFVQRRSDLHNILRLKLQQAEPG